MGKRSAQSKLEKLQKKVRKLQDKIANSDVNRKRNFAGGETSQKVTREEAGMNPEIMEEKENEPQNLDLATDACCSSVAGSNNESEDAVTSIRIIQDSSPSQEVVAAPSLNKEILEALRANVVSQKQETNFHETLADCWNRIIRDGLKKEERMELMDKYPRKGNCQLEAPSLNEEIESFINEKLRKRDTYFMLDQNVAGTGLSALGTAMSMILRENEEGVDKIKLLETLNDAGWIFAGLFHLLTIARRSCLYSSMDKKMKTILEKSTADQWLFGSELSEKVKSARTAEKVGSTLKFQPAQKKFPGRQGNWKGPFVRHTQQGQLQAGTSMRWAQRPIAGYRPQEVRGPRVSAQNRFQHRTSNPQAAQARNRK